MPAVLQIQKKKNTYPGAFFRENTINGDPQHFIIQYPISKMLLKDPGF